MSRRECSAESKRCGPGGASANSTREMSMIRLPRSRALLAAVLFSSGPLTYHDTLEAQRMNAGAAEAAYQVVHGWPVLPAGQILGQATGVGVDSNDDVFVFHRAGRIWSDPAPTDPIPGATVMLFHGRTGQLLASWGENLFIMPHGLTVDHQDNVWLTDVGAHQVFKFSHDGRLLLTLGQRGVAGADSAHFALPTAVAVLPDGSFYVSDGYANTRVIKFSPEGRYLFEWGRPGSGPGQFDLPHGIALDAAGRVYVADRSNARVQIFEGDGRFITEWKGDEIGRPYEVAVGRNGYVYIIDGGDQPQSPPDRSRVVKLDSAGNLVATFGRYGNYDGQFLLGHDIAVDSRGAVYVVDAWGQRVQKFLPRR